MNNLYRLLGEEAFLPWGFVAPQAFFHPASPPESELQSAATSNRYRTCQRVPAAALQLQVMQFSLRNTPETQGFALIWQVQCTPPQPGCRPPPSPAPYLDLKEQPC
jgi:hypothetical protein